jgi:nucleoid DNA-binding protein
MQRARQSVRRNQIWKTSVGSINPEEKMTQSELVDALAAKLGKSKADIAEILAAFGSAVTDELKKDGAFVVLPQLGRLKSSTRPARKGRNPRTGETIDIAAKRIVGFAASEVLIKAIAH